MNLAVTLDAQWRADRSFWLKHLVLPFVLLAGVLYVMETSSLDLWLADHWFAAEGHRWTLRDHWLTNDVIHRYGKRALILLWLAILAAWWASLRQPALELWRKPLGYLLVCMALLPTLIAHSKHYSPVPCPWDLLRYGGDLAYHHNLDYNFGPTDQGHCFPAGHASGGYALLAVYFAAYPFTRRPWLFLLPGLLTGLVFGLGQQARGAHFVSHDVWTMGLSWFGALALFMLFRPHGWHQRPASELLMEHAR